MFIEVSMGSMGEVPDVLEAHIPTSEQLIGPGPIKIPGVASITRAVVQGQKFGLDFWMKFIELLL